MTAASWQIAFKELAAVIRVIRVYPRDPRSHPPCPFAYRDSRLRRESLDRR